MENTVRRWVCTILAISMAVISIILFDSYNKFSAKWWIFSVALVGVILAALIIFVMYKMDFLDLAENYPKLVIILLALGFIICSVAGVYFTEPVRDGKSLSQIQAEKEDYSYENTRTGIWYYAAFRGGGTDDGGGNYSISTSSNKDMGVVYLVILVIILIIGSALVPHFWVMSLVVLTALMATFAVREWWLLKDKETYSW